MSVTRAPPRAAASAAAQPADPAPTTMTSLLWLRAICPV